MLSCVWLCVLYQRVCVYDSVMCACYVFMHVRMCKYSILLIRESYVVTMHTIICYIVSGYVLFTTGVINCVMY